MHAVTGDETGFVKLVALKRKAVVTRCGAQSRENGVSQLAWLPGSSSHVAALSKRGVLRVWDTLTEKATHTCVDAGEDAALLSVLPAAFITCSRSGIVKVFSQTAENASKGALREFSVGKDVDCARFHAGAGVVAVGGHEHDLALFDVEAGGAATFQARNVANTSLDLRVPVWVSALQFLPAVGAAQGDAASSSSAARSDASPHVLAVVSRHRHVRIYDVRAGRRPMHSVEVGEFALTAVEATCDARSVLVGDSVGSLRRLDLRAGLRQTAVYKGIGGCVRALAVSPVQPYVVSAGLDRCLHVHHIETRERLRRVYLKQCLTAMLLAPVAPGREAAAKGCEEEDCSSFLLAPEPPPDARVRITYVRGVAIPPARPAATQDDDDDDALWADLDRRASAAIGSARTADGAIAQQQVAGQKHPRSSAAGLGAFGGDTHSSASQSNDENSGGGRSNDEEDDAFNLEDGDGASDAPLPVAKSGAARRGGSEDDDGTGSESENNDASSDAKDNSEEEEDDDDDPLVSSAEAAKSLRREVEAVQRSEARRGSTSGKLTAGTGRRSSGAAAAVATAVSGARTGASTGSGPRRGVPVRPASRKGL